MTFPQPTPAPAGKVWDSVNGKWVDASATVVGAPVLNPNRQTPASDPYLWPSRDGNVAWTNPDGSAIRNPDRDPSLDPESRPHNEPNPDNLKNHGPNPGAGPNPIGYPGYSHMHPGHIGLRDPGGTGPKPVLGYPNASDSPTNPVYPGPSGVMQGGTVLTQDRATQDASGNITLTTFEVGTGKVLKTTVMRRSR